MIDRGAPAHDALLPSVAQRAAAAIAASLELGTELRAVDGWPLEHGNQMLAAEISGGVAGTLVLALNDAGDSPSRLPADRVASALAAAATALTGALDVPVEIGTAVTVDVTERPMAVTAVIDGGVTIGLVGLSLDLETLDGGAGPFDPSELAAGPAHFEPASFADETPWGPATGRDPLSVLGNVEMIVTAELGRTKMPIRDLLSLAPGMVVEIDRAAGAPIDLLVNGRRLAAGEVVVIDEEFGIRITEIVAVDETAR